MKNLLVCLLIFFAVTACKDKSKKIVQDNFTQNTSVTSVVESSEIVISNGNEEFLKGNFTEAIKYYEEGLKENRAVAYYNMGVTYYMMRDIEAAERSFKQAAQEDPKFDEAVMNLVAVLAEQEKSVEAEEYVSRLVNKTKSARVYVDMANLSLKNGNTAKATYYYDKAIEIDPKSNFVLSNYGNFQVSIGNLDKGKEILLQIPDRDFAVNYNLAYIEWLQNNPSDAYEYALQAASMSEGSKEGEDKLAELFRIMKRYTDEAETLRKLIEWSREKSYRIRLVKSYIHSGSLNKAEDEVNHLIKDYPNDPESIVVYYSVQIVRGRIEFAGDFIKKEFAKNRNDDLLLYHTVKHISLYDGKLNEAARILTTNKQTPLVNLARAAYNLASRNIPVARTALEKVTPSAHNDYYMYKTFLTFKEGNYREAEVTALKIDETNPEYFWYNFTLAWNLHKPERIKELIRTYEQDFVITARVPEFKFKLIPVPEDLAFSFKFTGRGEDIAAILMYPMFIEPDEMYPFLGLGYKLLKESDQAAALVELNKSLKFSDGVKYNNDGVVKILNYDYAGAIKDLAKAEQLLPLNPFVHFNTGVASFLLGDLKEAQTRFDRTIKLNRYFAPAYIGKGLCEDRYAQTAEAKKNYDAAVRNAIEYMGLNNDIVLPMITQARFLSYVAQNRPDTLLTELSRSTNIDNFNRGLTAIGRYMQSLDPKVLSTLTSNPFYHSKEVHYLLNLMNMPLSDYAEQDTKDINTLMSAKYITAMRNRSFNEQFMAPYMSDKAALTDVVNIASLLQDRALGLRYLQRLSNVDVYYPLQYKASLYFFMWTEDFINAEASYTTLNRYNYTDIDVEYYMLLYFLLNYNSIRLADSLQNFQEAYPTDYRGRMIEVFKDLSENNINSFLRKMPSLLNNEPFLFNKMPIMLDINRF